MHDENHRPETRADMFDAAFATFLVAAQAKCTADYAHAWADGKPPQLSAERGRRYIPAVRPIKDGWVWCAGRDHWEFHGPAGYYWHGSAGNAYEARYKGWMAWLEKQGVNLDVEAEGSK